MTAAFTQLTRIFGREIASPDAARAAITSSPAVLADALFAEAADSDDVTGIESALDYLEGRLAFLGNLVEPAAASEIRDAFRKRLRAWE
jgi:hypothetical protein